MNNHTTSITTNKKHHYRELLAIGIPIIIGQLGTIILGFADTLMIGHHSTPELAAAGLVNNIFGLVFVSYMGFTYGLTPIIGRLYGEERTDRGRCHPIPWQGRSIHRVSVPTYYIYRRGTPQCSGNHPWACRCR